MGKLLWIYEKHISQCQIWELEFYKSIWYKKGEKDFKWMCQWGESYFSISGIKIRIIKHTHIYVFVYLWNP